MKLAMMGISGSGKDYLASHLTTKYDYVRFSFSDQLKLISHNIFPWMKVDYPPLEKEQALKLKLKTGEIINKSPRDIWLSLNDLRKIESKLFIRMLDEQVTDFLERPIPHKYSVENIVISDVRTNDEFLWCKENGFKVIYIYPNKKIYKDYKIDRDINENRDKASYLFENNFNGRNDFEYFYKTEILK